VQVVLRADASSTIGYGHLMRCLSLARALRDDGADCVFVSRPAEGDLLNRIERTGFPVLRIADLSAPATAAALRIADLRPDWLVVDHYELDRTWETAMRGNVQKIMAIDDRPRRPHDCDLLLDQNLVESTHDVPTRETEVTSLIGVEYALLQPEYPELRKQARPRRGAIRRVLIAFGGSDQFGVTLAALRATLTSTRADVAIDVVIPSVIPDRVAIEAEAAASPQVTVHQDAPTLAPLILAADLGIGAAGTTAWERLCLGLPSIVITLAANQEPNAAALDRLGLAIWSGGIDAASALPSAIAKIVDTGIEEDWSRRCLASIDGRGAARVSAVLTASGSIPLRVRFADAGDEARLLRWANDPVTRRDSFSPRPIAPAEHHEWFHRVLGDEAVRQLIIETEHGAEVGQARFHRRDGEWEVHYAVAPEFRGRKLGTRLLGAALDEFQREHRGRIVGRVKTSNPASRKIFETLGFDLDHVDADTRTYARIQ
jgi:UDP-2,4-diacetamido-2,4,6-trideoxy-beta-L-altropyranose hydrolase